MDKYLNINNILLFLSLCNSIFSNSIICMFISWTLTHSLLICGQFSAKMWPVLFMKSFRFHSKHILVAMVPAYKKLTQSIKKKNQPEVALLVVFS